MEELKGTLRHGGWYLEEYCPTCCHVTKTTYLSEVFDRFKDKEVVITIKEKE